VLIQIFYFQLIKILKNWDCIVNQILEQLRIEGINSKKNLIRRLYEILPYWSNLQISMERRRKISINKLRSL